MVILGMLVERPNEVVTREELQQRLWPGDTFVDFEQSLNAAIRRLRSVLDDSAESPRYIETLARRGYRWIAPFRDEPAVSAMPPTRTAPPLPARTWWVRRAVWFGVAACLAATVIFFAARGLRSRRSSPKLMLIVLPFQNLSQDPQQEYFADGMTEEMITQLGSLDPRHLGVVARTSTMQYKGSHKGTAQIAQELKVGYLLEGVYGSRDRASALQLS